MFTTVKKLDPDHPVDKAILGLVKKGLVELYFDKESNQVMVSLTVKGNQLSDELIASGYEPKPADELTEEDKKQVEDFLKKSEKFLDSI